MSIGATRQSLFTNVPGRKGSAKTTLSLSIMLDCLHERTRAWLRGWGCRDRTNQAAWKLPGVGGGPDSTAGLMAYEESGGSREAAGLGTLAPPPSWAGNGDALARTRQTGGIEQSAPSTPRCPQGSRPRLASRIPLPGKRG